MLKRFNVILVFVLGLSYFSCTEVNSSNHKLYSDTLRIENDLRNITKTPNSRNFQNIETLNFVADYIFNKLSENCDTVCFQPYYVNGVEYKNVIGSIGVDKSERIIVGAHYDVAGDQEGRAIL